MIESLTGASTSAHWRCSHNSGLPGHAITTGQPGNATIKINRQILGGNLTALLAFVVLGGASVRGQGCPPRYSQDFDQMTPPVLPADWTATQGVNVTAAPFWVTSPITPDTPPNDVFSSAPDNILDNRLDAPPIFASIWDNSVTFRHSYELEEGFDGAVLEISTPSINGGAFTDVTDPAVGGQFFGAGGYNTTISTRPRVQLPAEWPGAETPTVTSWFYSILDLLIRISSTTLSCAFAWPRTTAAPPRAGASIRFVGTTTNARRRRPHLHHRRPQRRQ